MVFGSFKIFWHSHLSGFQTQKLFGGDGGMMLHQNLSRFQVAFPLAENILFAIYSVFCHQIAGEIICSVLVGI